MAELVYDQKERIGAWVAQQVGQGADWGSFYALGVVSGDDVIAGVVFNNFNGANATCHIAIARYTRLVPAMVQAACKYAFNFAGLKRLTGMVPSNEPQVLAFDKHLGFEEEFVMKDGAPGADMHVLVMWPDTCRWLRKE
jgi:RimJ/RimL family protein N-acetyltransferase